MRPKLNKAQRLSLMKDFNTSLLTQPPYKPFLLNTKLTSNPFLKDQEKFHYIVYRLNEYNKKVTNGQIKDQYEVMTFEKLHALTSDLSQIQQREDQVERLQEIFKWFKDQQRLFQQRSDQGQIRYKTTKQTRDGIEVPQKQKAMSPKSQKDQIPTQKLRRLSLPFKKNWRTAHKQLQIPSVRLQQYKRKIINIVPFTEHKQQKKAPRVIYPKIQKLQQPKQQEEEVVQEGQQKQGQQGEQQQEGQGEVKQGQQPPNQEQGNLGGFGEQPEEPQEEEQEPEQVKDKLAPRFKPYTKQHDDIKRKEYKEAYLFYRGEESPVQRRMQDRYLIKQQHKLNKQKSDQIGIDFVHEWGVNKSKYEKELQKKIQNMNLKPRYSFSEEAPPQVERINIKDQIKYGFSAELRKPSNNVSVDISEFQLPKIDEPYRIQKERRKDDLKSLQKKFKKMLNLTDYEGREVSQSLCQHTSRKRGLSQILRDHSNSKERLRQLDEISLIKQKLSRTKAGIDMKSLSMAVCCPEDEQKIYEGQFPSKQLPKNPFWVQPAKKKKKKK